MIALDSSDFQCLLAAFFSLGFHNFTEMTGQGLGKRCLPAQLLVFWMLTNMSGDELL